MPIDEHRDEELNKIVYNSIVIIPDKEIKLTNHFFTCRHCGDKIRCNDKSIPDDYTCDSCKLGSCITTDPDEERDKERKADGW